MDDKGKLVLAYLLGVPVILVLSMVWDGYIASKLWSWFIVPQFGLAALSWRAAAGLGLVAGFLTHQARGSDWKLENGVLRELTPGEGAWAVLTQTVVRPSLLLAVGALWHSFMMG